MRDAPSAMVVVRPFAPQDQRAARALVLDGLAGHFGVLDDSFNRDLHDISVTFADGAFFVAMIDDDVAGTGGLFLQADGTANVVRMSTAARYRRRGVGRAILRRLIEEARVRGCHRITLATNADWDDAIGFYRASGFDEILRTDTGIVFAMALTADL